MPKPITPTCPTCNYDLTGLINQGASATCPECGNSARVDALMCVRKRSSNAITFELVLITPLIHAGLWRMLLPAVAPVDPGIARFAVGAMTLQLFYLSVFLCVRTINITRHGATWLETAFQISCWSVSTASTIYMLILVLYFQNIF